MKPKIIWKKPRIDWFLVWDYWDIHKIFRFNSGIPYLSIAFGPIRIRKFDYDICS